MKKTYLLFTCMTLSLGCVFGQTFTLTPDAEVHTELTSDSYSVADIYMQTTDLTGITFGWERIENTLDPGWDYSLCDYSACYTEIPEDGIMTPITDDQMAAGTKGFLKVTVNPHGISGVANVKFYVFDQDDHSIGDTINFTFNHINTSSIEENSIALSIFPNPSEGIVTISNEAAQIVDYSIYDLAGNVVANGAINSGSIETIDLTDLKKGVYIFTSVSNEGITRREKIVIQ